MGYCITLEKSNFRIEAKYVHEAFKVVKALGNGKDDPRASGGRHEKGVVSERWYSWMNDVNVDDWNHLADAMERWRYPIKTDDDGNVVGIAFNGEKIGQERILFEALAPFVAAGSSLQFLGEDGDRWRWIFNGKNLKEQKGKTTFVND